MKFILILIALCFSAGAYAADTVLVDRDGVTTPVDAGSLSGVATAAQGAAVDKVAGTVYLLADYASLQAAVDVAYAAGGGTVLNTKGSTVNIATTFRPKTNVLVDLNGGTLKWTGGASGVMVENDATTYGAKLTGLFNGKIDAGSNTTYVFKFHSLRSSYYGDLTLVSANTNLEFMHLYADAQVDDPQDGVRNTYGNTFGPFRTDAGIGGVPVVGKVLTLEGFNDSGNWRGVTMNTFKGPWHLFTNGTGIDFKQYCDSNVFEGMYQITLTNQTTPGTCVVFNNSATPSSAIDVWGEHFDHLSCETWYPALAGQKAVVINHAGGITIDYLGNDRVAQGSWPVGMVTDNYSQGHKINYVEGAPTYLVKEYLKGDFTIKGTGNGLVFPDNSKITSAPDSTSCGTGQHISAFDASTGAFTCTADTSNSEGSTDANAIHKATAGEIAAITQKTTPVSGDWLLIEDSASSNAKKRINIGSLPAPFTISDSVSTTSSSVAASSTAVKNAYDTATAKQSPATTLAGYGITDGVVATGKSGGQTIIGGTGASELLTLQSTSHGTKNGILLDTAVFFDTVYSRGLFAMNPTVKSTSGFPGSKLHLVAENTVAADDASTRQDMYSTASAFPTTAYYRARGTFATPVKLVSGDRLGGVAARGYYGVSGSGGAFPGGGTAAMFFNTEEDFNDSTHLGTRITFETTATGSGTRTEKIRIHGSGGVSIGNTTDPGANNLKVTGDVTAASFNGSALGTAAFTASTAYATSAQGTKADSAIQEGSTHSQGTSTTLDVGAKDGHRINAASGTVSLTLSNLVDGKYFDIEIVSTSGALTLNQPLFTGAYFPNGNNSATVSANTRSHYACKGYATNKAVCYTESESKSWP